MKIVTGALISVGLIGFVWYLVLLYLRRFDRRGEVDQTDDNSFESRIPEYASTIVAWLEKERPYTDAGFKLTDVAKVVPLNRTYLSRVFNKGIGVNFNDYIRDLRMKDARRLLEDNPDMSIADVAERCGFAGHTSFHRSFVSAVGMTPGEYRQRRLAARQKESGPFHNHRGQSGDKAG